MVFLREYITRHLVRKQFLLMYSAHYFAEQTSVAEVACKPALKFCSNQNEFNWLFPRQCFISRRWELFAL